MISHVCACLPATEKNGLIFHTFCPIQSKCKVSPYLKLLQPYCSRFTEISKNGTECMTIALGAIFCRFFAKLLLY